MSRIRIVTDSTAYLSQEFLDKSGVVVVPLVVNFRGESYPEGSVYTNEEFFRMVDESPTLPTTSQPPVGEFVEAFKQLFADGAEDIIGIFLSSDLSGTYYSVKTAVEMLNSERIHLFDSRYSVNSMQYMVEQAVKMAGQGRSVAEIMAELESIKQKLHLFFVVQTLEHLRKGGRIGGAASLIGTLLQVKPILFLHDGKIDVFDKVRTKSKALARVVEELDKAMASGKPQWVGILHVNAKAEAEALAAELRVKYPQQEISFSEAGQVIGTHVGKGTVGLSFLEI